MKKFILFALIVFAFTVKISAQYSYHNFNFGGVNRQYLIYIPQGYDSTQPTPFVLVLHGLGDTISNFVGINMNQVADTAHFIFAMPQALVDPTFGAAWNSGAGGFGVYPNVGVDDVGFLNALIDSVSAHYNVDQTRVFSTGFSMGGFMTNRLGCELNNRIAAIASVSGTIGSGITCHPTRAIPSAHFHGTADQTVNYTGDPFGMDPEALVSYWMHHDHTDTVPASIDTFPNRVNDGKVVVHYKYLNGAYGTEVEFFKVIGGQHEWLDAANDINYSVEIWRFFRRFSWTPQFNAIEETSSQLDIDLYPNPSTDFVNIQLPVLSAAAQISISDMTGRVILNSHGTSTELLTINVSKLNAGMYIVNIASGDQHLSRKLFVTG
ncbi:MAG: hypothetical protein JWO06_467 [Bacteroidota bacterium]|nr:hypothetical protein [Bacteroidota bacterium]